MCSHVAATLFSIDAIVKNDTAYTSLPCEWIRSSGAKGQYKESCKMDFNSVQEKKKNQETSALSLPSTSIIILESKIPPMTDEEAKEFFRELRNAVLNV